LKVIAQAVHRAIVGFDWVVLGRRNLVGQQVEVRDAARTGSPRLQVAEDQSSCSGQPLPQGFGQAKFTSVQCNNNNETPLPSPSFYSSKVASSTK